MAEEIDVVGSVGDASGADLAGGRDNAVYSPPPAPRSGSNATAAPPAAPPRSTADAVRSLVAEINAQLASVDRVLELHVDAASGLTVATIKDGRTGAVLQQIPSADQVHLAEMLRAWAHGKSALLDLIA